MQLGKAARLLFLFRGIAGLPLPLAYRAAGMIGSIDCFFMPAYLKAISAGMAYVNTGSFSLAERQVKGFTKRHGQMMAREIVDSYIVSGRGMAALGRICSLSGADLVRQKLGRGNGLIILVCHYSRLNMVACSLGCSGISTGIITQCVDRRNKLLDWVDRSYLSGKLKRYHEVTRGTLVTLEDNLRPIYKALLRNEAVILLMDAFHPRFKRFNSYPFLGGRVRLPVGALRLAEKTGAPMVYGVARENGWRVEVNIRDLPLPAEAALEAAVAELGADIVKRPWEWWQWFNIREIWRPEN